MFKAPENVNWKVFSIFIVLVLLNLIFGIASICLKKEKKIVFRIMGNLLVVSLISFFVYIAYRVSWCQDYKWYNKIYETSNHKDKGYVFLCDLFKNMGYEFNIFRTCVYLLSYSLMFISLTCFKANKNLCFGLYAFYPWCYHAFQTRTCLGFAIIMLACTALLLKGKWKIIGIPIFACLIYCAYTIHGSMLLYAVLAVVFLTFKNKNYFAGIGFILSVVLIILFYNGQNVIVDMVPDFIYEKYFVLYTVHKPNIKEYTSLLFGMILQLFSVTFAVIGFTGITNKTESTDLLIPVENIRSYYTDYHNMKCVFFMVICMFCLMPVFTLNTDFLRLERNFVIFVYAGLTISARNAKHKFLNPWIILSIISMLAANYVLLDFSNTWEAGGIEKAFWIFFTYPPVAA